MYRQKRIYGSSKWKHRWYAVCLSGMMIFVLVCMGVGGRGGAATVYADVVPGGNIADPVTRAVDIAKPAVARIILAMIGQLTVTFSNGQSVTFPQTTQNGLNGYPFAILGTGSFISAHGDILTADHVVHPIQDDKMSLDQGLQQLAAQDVANYMNQNLKQHVTANQVVQALADGQLASTSQYQQAFSRVYLSTEFSGPLNVPDFQSIPSSQYADIDQIKQFSPSDVQDIAIIHVSGMDNMPMLQLGDSSAVQEQDQLRIIGFPGNGDVSTAPTDLLTPSINEVFVSSIKSTDAGSPLIQVGGNVEQGDSGGPALDSKGHVVGIVSFQLAATNGSTSFLRTSNSAQQLIRAAGIDTTPSPFQQAWQQAFGDYASQTPGHWHQAVKEFQQLASLYPQFKAIGPFLQYASQQAQTEKATQEPQSSNPGGSGQTGSISINLLYIIGGGAALLLIVVVVAGLAMSRRRQPTLGGVASANPGQMTGYNAPLGSGLYNPTQANSMPGFTQQSGQGLPMTPSQPPVYPSYMQPSAYRPPVSQVPPSSVSWAQQAYQPPASPAPTADALSAFGAPPSTPVPDASLVARPQTPVSQWRTWPCGHTNRDDARFCGICGEPAPPVTRRIEQ